jgi:hypothetical protein
MQITNDERLLDRLSAEPASKPWFSVARELKLKPIWP